MKKNYTFRRTASLIGSIIMLIVFGIIIFTAINNPVYSVLGAGTGAIFIIILIIIACLPAFVSFSGKLELENGILSRRYLLIKIWQVQVSDIADIFTGNSVRKAGIRELGLCFREKNGKYHETPYIIPKQAELIQDLLAINPNMQFHTDPADLQKARGYVIGV